MKKMREKKGKNRMRRLSRKKNMRRKKIIMLRRLASSRRKKIVRLCSVRNKRGKEYEEEAYKAEEDDKLENKDDC